jgi:pimeloyl-ACP methyl ester carboxylesterase
MAPLPAFHDGVTGEVQTAYADDLTPGGRDPATPLVVLVPGMGDLRASYRFLAPALKEAGHRVACTDLRGHGDSDAMFSSARRASSVICARVRGGAAAGSTVSCMVSSFRFGGGWDLGPAGRSHASAGPLS